MKKYKIIFSDIDGTLLNDENQVPKETVEELQSLDKRGIPFVLVSARMPEGMRPIREELGIHAPMVCYSGGLVLGPDNEEIYSCLMDLDLACEIKNLVEKEFPQVVCGTYGGEHWVVDDGADPWVLREQEITHLVPETGDIREIFGKTGVKIVCGKYNISLEQAMSFGDGQNDLDMLNAVGAGFAMANAPEEVKLAAPFVTPADNQHQGLLAVLRKYFATNIY